MIIVMIADDNHYDYHYDYNYDVFVADYDHGIDDNVDNDENDVALIALIKMINPQHSMSNTQLLVVMDGPITDELKAAAAAAGGEVILFADVEQLGVENPTPHVDPSADSLAFVMYTSGTTGNPKGNQSVCVTCSHSVLFSVFLSYFQTVIVSVFLSYFPTHTFSLSVLLSVFPVGFRLFFAHILRRLQMMSVCLSVCLSV